MKYILALLLMCIAVNSRAGKILDPEIWTHTGTGKDVYVNAFHSSQFPNKEASGSRHLLFMCFKTTWQGYTQDQRDWIKGGIADLLDGTKRLSRTNLDAWVTPAASRGITFIPLGPTAEPATNPNALYFVICPVGKTAVQALTWLGLESPEVLP